MACGSLSGSGIVPPVEGPVGTDRVSDAASGGREKFGKDFYLRPAMTCVRDFLGKALVHQTPMGRLSGVINDVEAYPAFADDVHHGNTRTKRTAIMWEAGGRAYV